MHRLCTQYKEWTHAISVASNGNGHVSVECARVFTCRVQYINSNSRLSHLTNAKKRVLMDQHWSKINIITFSQIKYQTSGCRRLIVNCALIDRYMCTPTGKTNHGNFSSSFCIRLRLVHRQLLLIGYHVAISSSLQITRPVPELQLWFIFDSLQ